MTKPRQKNPKSDGTYQGPPLTEPRLGRPIAADFAHAYRQRASAERQAERWNAILEHDPFLGPAAGYRVGVGPLASTLGDGQRWDLIWIFAEPRSHAG
jgi:hypothetical protein